MVAISLADFCQEYHRQASPGSQYFLWLGSILSNISQSAFPLLPENKLPHWWHKTLFGFDLVGVEVEGLWIGLIIENQCYMYPTKFKSLLNFTEI